jgi:Ser/Thr protein kinase RdoA (MazF antagonist)
MFVRVVPQVLNKYGLIAKTVSSAQKGYRSESYPIELEDNTTLNLIFFKREPGIVDRINRADYAANAAAAAGLPARTRHDNRLLRVADNTYAGLYHYLPGQTVSWEAFSMKHIKLLGHAMGELHTALKGQLPIDEFRVSDELLPLLERMESYFARQVVIDAMRLKLDVSFDVSTLKSYKDLVLRTEHLPGQQMLHMDMVRGNVLFDASKPDDYLQISDLALTGIIDFEKAAYGHPGFEVARTLAFLLVDSPKPATDIYRYFLDSGYHKRGGQPLPDPRLLTSLIRLFLLHDFYKFLRHTPYESLKDNYHYNRTRDLLQQYGMIS